MICRIFTTDLANSPAPSRAVILSEVSVCEAHDNAVEGPRFAEAPSEVEGEAEGIPTSPVLQQRRPSTLAGQRVMCSFLLCRKNALSRRLRRRETVGVLRLRISICEQIGMLRSG